MPTTYRRKLIEVDLPLDTINDRVNPREVRPTARLTVCSEFMVGTPTLGVMPSRHLCQSGG